MASTKLVTSQMGQPWQPQEQELRFCVPPALQTAPSEHPPLSPHQVICYSFVQPLSIFSSYLKTADHGKDASKNTRTVPVQPKPGKAKSSSLFQYQNEVLFQALRDHSQF